MSDPAPTPRFSVIVAAHSGGKFAVETVRSAQNQTFPDFELILVDDGAPAGMLDFVPQLSDARIRMVNGERRGASAARNTGIRAARGEWIAFLDDDDLWLPGKLQAHQRAVQEYPETDLTFDWSQLIDERGNHSGLTTRPWRGPISFRQILEDYVMGNASAVVLRRSALERVGLMNPELRSAGDLDLCLRIAALRPDNCRAVPEYLTLYRRHSGQMTSRWRKIENDWRSLMALVPGYAPLALGPSLAIGDSNMRRYLAWVASQSGEGWTAIRLTLSAIGRAPVYAIADRRNWMMLAVACGRVALPDGLFHRGLDWGKQFLR